MRGTTGWRCSERSYGTKAWRAYLRGGERSYMTMVRRAELCDGGAVFGATGRRCGERYNGMEVQ